MSFLVYRNDMLGRYQKYTQDAVNLCARWIDGDDLKQCMETGVKSEKYNELQKLMNDVKEVYSDLEFLYIIEPLGIQPPDNMMDVLAAVRAAGVADGTDGLTDLGNYTGDAYPPDVAANYLARMDRDETVTFFRNDTDFGRIYTAIRPVLDHSGEPVAVLCADVRIDDIYAAQRNFAQMSVGAGLISAAILVFSMAAWLRRRIIRPVSLLQTSAEAFAESSHGQVDRDGWKHLTFRDPDIHTQDELEALSSAISTMVSDMQTYAEELVNADRQLDSMKAHVMKMDVLAYRDTLTGAGNKAAYEKAKPRLDWDILSGRADFTIVMADLNYLKRINDSFGHDKGNLYIKKMYEMLDRAFPQSPIFRIGGDEFVVIAEGSEKENCTRIVQELKDEMEKMSKDRSLEPWEMVSTAIGIAEFDRATDSGVDDVFRRADQAMYEDKSTMRAGRE